MPLTLVVETLDPITNRWLERARWDEETIPGVSNYHEALFCSHCGRVWGRRMWMSGAKLSWWLTLRACHLSPFTFYDLDRWPSLPPSVQETFANDFLTDPSAFGYTFAGPPHSSPDP